MKLSSGFLIGLAALPLMFSLSVSAYEPTKAENQEMLDYIVQCPARAKDLEKAGDQLAASGDAATAVQNYAHAIALIAVYSDYHIAFFRAAEPVREGWKITKVDIGKQGYNSGIRAGDIITAVDGVSIAGRSRVQTSNMIVENPFFPSVLTVRRNGADPIQIKMVIPDLGFNDLTLENWGDVTRLLEKQVVLYSKMSTRPALPPEVREMAVKAQTMAKSASKSTDIKAASNQFKLTSLAAPWWADLYVNYGLFQDASGDAIGARQSFENYALLNPQGHDLDAVKAKITGLSSKADDQKKLQDWEGWWSQSFNGRRQTTGMRVTRDGKLLFINNLDKNKPWLRATITGDNTAQAIVRFSSDSSVLTSAFLNAVNKCFNGAMELSTTMTLSQDRKQLTLESYNDLDIDFANCAIVRQNKSTMVWVK